MNKILTIPLVISSLTAVSPGGLPQSSASSSQIQTVLGIVFGIVGALALLFMVISGVRYMLSAGDPQKAARAREGIIYALVGLALAIFAETIVVFVVGKVG
jgi:tellurite resistance protein TehA-like permease